MTTQQKAAVKLSWPVVVIVGMGLTFMGFVLWVIPSDQPELRTQLVLGLLALVGALVTALIQRLAAKIERVEQQTNGHMTRLISAKTTPDDSYGEQAIDVPLTGPVRASKADPRPNQRRGVL